ncbi:MAG: hypothetical protein EU551_02165 [Promethearchaeota archaeon]|nr:MAG: hypothetical protein EU551_02165 [Candidatus Lokiarchaeota archaeon]
MSKDNSNILENFWENIYEIFERKPKRESVIKLLLQLGFSIKKIDIIDNKKEDSENKKPYKVKVYCGKVKIPTRSIADALDIDRRSVISAIEDIAEISELYKIFSNIKPAGLFLEGQNRSIIEITANSKESGIIAKVTELIADENISVRQILATDPDLDPNPKLIILTNREITGDIMAKILEVNGVETATFIKG